MAGWILVPCLVKLRSEFNEIAPNRDKASDGSVGDLAHQNSQSDHNPDETGNVPIRDADSTNEVHAIDVDRDLRTPGLDMEAVVQFLLARCRGGQEGRLRYIIFNRRIWSASNGWRQQAYTGSNPHDHHAHFSASYKTAHEASTASWHLEDIPVALTDADKSFITSTVKAAVKAEVAAALAGLEIPTAAENAETLWHRVRNDQRPLWSDTARNLLEARLTKAILEGVAIEPYPANEGKLD
jgi:hypothetical protein